MTKNYAFDSEQIRKINEAMRIYQGLNANIVSAISEAIRSIPPDYIESLQKIKKNIGAIVSEIALSIITQHNKTIGNISRALLELVKYSYPTFEQIRVLQKNMQEIMGDCNFTNAPDDEFNTLSESEKDQIIEAVEVIISKPENWQIALMELFNKLKEYNPVLARAFIWVLGTIIAIFIGTMSNIISDAVKDTPLRQEPSKDSPIITTIIKNQVVYVINEVPYYYEIEFENAETGEILRGWASKHSIKPQDDTIEQGDEADE